MTFIATASNLIELPQVVELIARLGSDQIIVNELQMVGSATENEEVLEVSPERFQAALDASLPVAQRLGVGVTVIRAASAADEWDARRGWRRWSVSPDCELKLCNHSTRTLGRLAEFDYNSIRRLASSLADEDYKSLRHSVDNCLCFERAWPGAFQLRRVIPSMTTTRSRSDTSPDAELPSHYFELYELAVEMADRVSARRGVANSFFLTINTGIVALLANQSPRCTWPRRESSSRFHGGRCCGAIGSSIEPNSRSS